MLYSFNGDTDFFHGHWSLAPYLLIISKMSIDLIKENGLTLTKARSRSYHGETIINADYAEDLALLANALIQAESQLYSL